MTDADVIVVGAGLAGQAFWSLGGLFLVDTFEQRRLRICDSPELALHDWLGSAGFARGSVTLRFRHRVDMLCTNGGALAGVSGTVLEPSSAGRGQPSSRTPVGEFDLSAPAVIVTSGGLGANHELVREAWPSTLGRPPRDGCSPASPTTSRDGCSRSPGRSST